MSGITGLLLAGGQGLRMSTDGRGTAKGLVSFRGRPMIAHVIERLGPQVDALLLNANGDPVPWAAFGLPVLPDTVGGYAGPLAGLHAGLRAAATPWVLTAPCDSPFLPQDLAARLMSAATAAGTRVATVRTGRWTHPVFSLVHASLVDDLESFLGDGGRKIDAWTARHAPVEVDFGDETPFRNINTPEDLARWSDDA